MKIVFTDSATVFSAADIDIAAALALPPLLSKEDAAAAFHEKGGNETEILIPGAAPAVHGDYDPPWLGMLIEKSR